MKKLILMLAAGVMTCSMSLAMADDAKQPSEKQLAQRQRMTDCSKDAKAKGLKGADRKAYMKSCLSGSTTPSTTAATPAPAPAKADKEAKKAAKTAQQEKMKSCNADAKTKGLKGADRKTFMKSCLSASAN